MRKSTLIAMTYIIHHQASVLHLPLYVCHRTGIGIVRCRRQAFIGIPINAVHLHFGITLFHFLRDLLSHVQMLVVISVITHHANDIAPQTGISFLHVIDGFVHHNLRIGLCRHGKTSDT